MLASYSLLIAIYFLPVAAWYLGTNVTEDAEVLNLLRWSGIGSPLMTAFWVPLESDFKNPEVRAGWILVLRYLALSSGLIVAMFAVASIVLRQRLGITGR
jgi:hypothetical protein